MKTLPWQRRYRLLLNMAKAALAWERLWPSLWPAVAVAAIFITVALFDWLPMLPFWVHSLVLVVFAGTLGFLVRGAFRGFIPVDEKTAQSRLERDSGLDHRPLAALHDRLAIGQGPSEGDRKTRTLWSAHLKRMADAAARLSVHWPKPGLARLDRFGLRAVVLLFLVIAAAAGGTDAIGRLERALVPEMTLGGNGPLELDVWITPPAYTGLAPMFLDKTPVQVAGGVPATISTAVKAPVGSTLLAQVTGIGRAPELVIGDKIIQFADIAQAGDEKKNGGSYRVETILEDADRIADTLVVRLDRHILARWPLAVVADKAPEVEFTRAPSRAGRGQLRLDYEARDDYGLAGVQVVIRHPQGHPVPGGRSAIRVELALPKLGSGRIEGSSVQDFSAHPWAGTPVLVELQAIDARGQAGISDAIKTVLPERIFNHPVARALVAARKQLNTPEPAVVAEVVAVLNGLAGRPKHFFDDTVVFLALSVAQSRLIYDETPEGIGAVQTLLWETALRIEDGKFSIAERDLKDIQDRLAQALNKEGNSDEIERLMDEFKDALDKYMAALAEYLDKKGLSQLPSDPTTQSIDSTDLQRMIETARDLARTGSVEAARQMLAELKRMLDSIKSGVQQGKPNEELAKAKRLMDKLRSLTQRQRQQLDKTFKRRQQAEGAMKGQPRPGGKGSQKGATDQEALRSDLRKLMMKMDDFLGAIPKPFGKAYQAMRDAVRSLKKGDLGEAQGQQTKALEQLRQGLDGMAEQMAQRMRGAVGIARGQRGRQPGRGNDPFGRRPGGSVGGSVDDGNVKIPNHMERRKAREILQELRRRAGERNRPAVERDYIDRLLKRF